MKPSIEVCLGVAISTCQFDDDASATIAYEKIQRALSEFNKYKNDKTETVEVETLEGKATFRLDSVQSVIINFAAAFEASLREKMMVEKTARAMREEMGLPELSR